MLLYVSCFKLERSSAEIPSPFFTKQKIIGTLPLRTKTSTPSHFGAEM